MTSKLAREEDYPRRLSQHFVTPTDFLKDLIPILMIEYHSIGTHLGRGLDWSMWTICSLPCNYTSRLHTQRRTRA